MYYVELQNKTTTTPQSAVLDNPPLQNCSEVSNTTSSQLYKRRYEEGYNLFDEGYYVWLKQNHPLYAKEWHKTAVRQQPPINTTVANAVSTSVATQSQNVSQTIQSPTEAPETSSQLYERRYEEGYDLFDEGYYVWLKKNHPLYAKEWHKTAVRQQPPSTTVNTTVANAVSTITSVATQSQNVSQTLQTTLASGTSQQHYMSKYLVQYVAPPVQKTGKRVTGARVLTSDECYKMLEEKEELKRKEQEEKEQRKLAREQKRKQKQEQLAEKRKKKTLNKSNVNNRVGGKGKGKTVQTKTSNDVDSNDTEDEEHHIDENEDQDCVCPECNGTWEQDKKKNNRAAWVTCSCLKWLHEKCTIQRPHDEDIDIDVYFCSDCAND